MVNASKQANTQNLNLISFEEIITDEWNALFEMTPASVMKQVAQITFENIHELIDNYQQYLTSDASINNFLNTLEMREKWVRLFESWVRQLLEMQFTDANHFVEVQTDIGEKLSRIGYPPHAVTKALRIIKSWLIKHILGQDWRKHKKIQAVSFITNLVGLSFEVRNHGYMKGVRHQTRLDETFRLTAMGNNIAMERERQRALLSEWEKALLATFYVDKHVHLQRLANSEFGIWFRHKATLVLEQTQSLDDVFKYIQIIDNEKLPKLEMIHVDDHHELGKHIAQIEKQLEKIRYIMSESFDAHLEFENAKDVLTKLLNRRFMHTVLSREINLQRRNESVGFGLLLLDLDYFKRVNDAFGHEAGDVVLQRAAAIITNAVRPSDFVFRYGGEEILIVLVEIEPHMMVGVADKIRMNIQEHQFNLPNGHHISITVSIGGVHAKDKYDYQTVINAADQALYSAKNKGRNNVYIDNG